MVEKGIVAGRAVYGHWTGPVAKGSIFFGKPIIHHGWIEMPGNIIYDPTRFEFEQVEPYIFYGPNDYYDEGGDLLRQENERPCPPFDTSTRTVRLELQPAQQEWLQARAGSTGVLSLDQIFWLANLSRKTLGIHAKPIYEALIRAGEAATIPLDNRLYYQLG